MKSDDPMGETILKRTLLEVRSARTRRRAVRSALAVAAVLMVITGFAFFPRPAAVRGPERTSADSVRPPEPVMEEKIAVMVWREGTPCLEWVELHDLGEVELEFSLDPVFAFADDGM